MSKNKKIITEYVASLPLDNLKKEKYLKQLLRYANVSQPPNITTQRTSDDGDFLNVTINKYSCNFGAGYNHDANYVCPSGLIFNPIKHLCDYRDSVPSQILSWTNFAVYISNINPTIIEYPGQHVSLNGQKNCDQVGWTYNY